MSQQLSHAFTLVFIQYFTAIIFFLCRDIGAVLSYTQSLLETARARGFTLYQALGTVLHGWAVVMQGEIEAGIGQIENGLAIWQSKCTQRMLLAFRLPQIFAYQEAGRIEEGLLLLAEALETVQETGQRKVQAELYRLQGELLLLDGGDELEARACFQRALRIARQQQARGWELRAATSLCRLAQRGGQAGGACQALREIYAWYQEGFDTPDLVEAGSVLGQVH